MDINDALQCADDPESNSVVETTLAAAVRRLSAENAELRGQIAPAVAVPAVPDKWREVLSTLIGIVESSTKFHGCDNVTKQARALLQSEQPK